MGLMSGAKSAYAKQRGTDEQNSRGSRLTSSVPNENAIRDFIAARLDLIETGLTLVDREHYLKNAGGAAGYLDIFARDALGRLVIIELKRTDGAAREAIQELFKYAALLRERYLVREIDYRLILLSVKWHELLIPFSELAKSAPFDLKAGKIVLGDDGWPTCIEPVTPVMTAAQRRFSKRHFLWGFDTEKQADTAIALIAAHMTKAGLSDFVLVKSQSIDPRISHRTYVYFAQQELRLSEYRTLIRSQLDDEAYAEFEDEIADLTEEEDQIGQAADAVWYPGYDDLFDAINPDHSEISHPEKAAHWFKEGAQRNVSVLRFGRFDDADLSVETIVAEVVGQAGTSDFHLRLTAETSSPPQMAALRAAIGNVFFFNSEWRNASLDLVGYAEKTGPATIAIIAFSNEDILRSIAGAAFEYPGYVPTFRLEITREGQEPETFMGLPEWDGSTFDFDAAFKSHFGEDPFAYFLACHFGENRGINADLMHDLGLRYIVFRAGENGPERVRVVGSSVVGSSRNILGSVFGLIEMNLEEVHKIVSMFMNHDQGFAASIEAWLNNPHNVAEREIQSRIPELAPQIEDRFWDGKLTECDLCGHPFNMARFMIDAHIRGGGANVCAACYLAESEGQGTIFERTERGWRMLGTERGEPVTSESSGHSGNDGA